MPIKYANPENVVKYGNISKIIKKGYVITHGTNIHNTRIALVRENKHKSVLGIILDEEGKSYLKECMKKGIQADLYIFNVANKNYVHCLADKESLGLIKHKTIKDNLKTKIKNLKLV